jgi:hypothetical protein
LYGFFRAFARSHGRKQKDFDFRFNCLKIDGRKTDNSLLSSSNESLHLVATNIGVAGSLTVGFRDEASYASRRRLMLQVFVFLIDGCGIDWNEIRARLNWTTDV